MIIGIDGRPANEAKRAGIGHMCAEFLSAIAPLAEAARDSLRIYLDEPALGSFPLSSEQADIRVLPKSRFWTQRELARELRRDPPDVFYTVALQTPLLCRCVRVATVLDAAPFTFGAYFTWRQRIFAILTMRAARRANSHFLAISEATRRDMTALIGIPGNRITTALLGTSGKFRPCNDAERIGLLRARHDLHNPYVLYVGRLQPRKNLVRLIEAFAAFRARHPDALHDLVLAGDKGWMENTIYEAARQSPARDHIRFLGFVAEDDLPVLTSEADVLALVSLWEGFGMPVVEAMACGTAVITSNCSSLPEVAGDAALLVDPYNVEDIACALERTLLDVSLRDKLKESGLIRARLFSWDTMARIVLDVLHAAARFPRSG